MVFHVYGVLDYLTFFSDASIVINILRYVKRILRYDMIHRKIDTYLIGDNIELCILRYSKHILLLD